MRVNSAQFSSKRSRLLVKNLIEAKKASNAERFRLSSWCRFAKMLRPYWTFVRRLENLWLQKAQSKKTTVLIPSKY